MLVFFGAPALARKIKFQYSGILEGSLCILFKSGLLLIFFRISCMLAGKDKKQFLLIPLFLYLLTSGCSYPVKNLDSRGETIICFGDSITEGKGVSKGKDYPCLLSRFLDREVINAGVSGDTTARALKRLSRDVLEKKPYLVIVELGGNDFLCKIPKRATLDNLEEIVNRIQSRGAMVVLVDVSWGIILSGYRKDYGDLAKRTGSIFIPSILKGVLDDPLRKYDCVHPNEEGCRIIAQRVYEKIKKYVK